LTPEREQEVRAHAKRLGLPPSITEELVREIAENEANKGGAKD
jgi:hypothetical protein